MTQPSKSRAPATVETYETEIEYVCPVRGRVKQKVTVKRLAPITAASETDSLPTKSLAAKLDAAFSGLEIVDDSLVEELETLPNDLPQDS